MQIKVKDFTFEISSPYAEGQPLGIAEARVLNSIRTDNIRNAILRKLDKLKNIGIQEDIIRDLDEYVKNVDESYQFPLDGRTQVEMLSIQREAEDLAKELAQKEAAERGLANDSDWIEQRALFLSKSEGVLGAARKKLEAKKEVAQAALRELLE